MKGWFQRFMAGRYGFDQFGGFLCISSLILIVIGAWVSPVLYWLGLAAIVYSYFRILSRNTRKRYSENLKYLSYQNRVTTWFGKQQVRFKQRKDYHYYRCPPVRPAAARAPWARQDQHHLPEVRPSVHQKELTRDVRICYALP